MAGWKKVKLGDILTAVDYGTAAKSDVTGKYPVLRMGNLENGYLVWDDLVYTSSEEEYAKYELKKGDILFNRTNSRDKVGKTSIYRGERPSIFAGYLIRLKVNNECDPYYVNYCMNSKRFAEFCKSVRTDAVGQSNINAQVLQTYDFSLPPLEEQKKIAATLSVWDSAIEKIEKLIDAKEDQKKSLIWKLIESNDNRKIKLGKVVVDKNKWRKSKLSDVASGFDYGMNAAAKEYDGKNKYIRITDIDDESHKFNYIDLVSPNAELEDKYRVNEGDILFARTGASTGKSYLYDKNDGILYFAGFLIRVHVLKDNPFFIYIQTLSSKYQNWLKKMSMRSGQPGVNAEEYKNLPVLVPTLPEQNVITEVLSAAEKELSLLKQQLENYKKQKQGLMQKLLTGLWRVK